MSDSRSQPSTEPLRLSMTSEAANIARVRGAVREFARQIGFLEDQSDSIAVAIDEALANVIQHGYEGREGQPIEVTAERICRDDHVGIQATICDNCRQVAPETIVGRDLSDVRPGGLGTHIMRTIMDEVEYTYREPVGMKLRLVKMLDPQAGTGTEINEYAGKESDDGR